jgi:predicted dehydrogenase
MKPLRVGVIGANWGMLAHLPAWREVGVEVAAVCTTRRETAEAASATYGVPKAYWDYREMVADPDLDIIDAGTRPDLRRDMVLAAVAHGKHVYASANMAATLDAAREMRDAVRAAGVVAALDSTMAETPAHRQLRTMIDEGYLGRPAVVQTRFHISLFNGPNPAGDYWRWFATASHGASAMRNLGTHSLHLLVSLLGPVEAVVAQETMGLSPWRFADGVEITPETADTGQMLVRFRSGVLGTVTTAWSTPSLTGWRMELSGDQGTLISQYPGFFPAGPDVELLAGQDGKPPERVAVPAPSSFGQPLTFEHSHDIAGVMRGFVAAIRGEGTVSPDFEQAFHVEAVLDAARRSIAEKCWATPEV